MRRYGYPIALLLSCALSACGSAPAGVNPDTRAYWSDPFWQEALLSTVQSAVHQPDTGTPIIGVNGMVRFTVSEGVIEHPEIVASTGYADLDKLMLQQVASAKPPETRDPHAGEPHEFELLLDMLTPLDSFQYNVYRAIEYQKFYPKDPIIRGDTGNTTVDFDYLDGKANNIVMTGSSKSRDLDKAAMTAVTKAIMPPAPAAYAGKPMHMEVIVCYTLFESPPGHDREPMPGGEKRDPGAWRPIQKDQRGTRLRRIQVNFLHPVQRGQPSKHSRVALPTTRVTRTTTPWWRASSAP